MIIPGINSVVPYIAQGVLFGAGGYPVGSTLNNNCVAHWKMNESTGLIMLDSSPNSLNGAINGTEINQTDGFEKAYLFEIVNSDTVVVPDSDIFSINGNGFAVSVWVKINSLPDTAGIIAKDSEWIINVLTNGAVEFITFGTSNRKGRITDAGEITIENWHNIVCLDDGGMYRSGMEIHINGTRKDTTNRDQFRIYEFTNTANPVTLGYDPYYGNYLDAYMDDIGIWNRELTASEITELQNPY